MITALRAAWDWQWALGVPGNLLASGLWIGAGVIFDRLFLAAARQRRRQMAAELHRLMHHVHADEAADLGHHLPD